MPATINTHAATMQLGSVIVLVSAPLAGKGTCTHNM